MLRPGIKSFRATIFFIPRRSEYKEWTIIASGPSLTSSDCEKVKTWREKDKNRRVIVVNTSYQPALWADILYACDGEWWNRYIEDVLVTFKGELWTQDLPAASKYGLNRIEGEKADGLGKNKIHYGANGGYQAINLAYLFGAKKIILLGFDMKRGKDNKSHWHGDHPGALNKNMPIKTWIKNFCKLAEDLKAEQIEVINSTRDTALECFNKIKLEVALCLN